MILQQKRNFIVYTDYYKKVKFLLTFEHFKINKGLLKDSSKLDETDCVLCFTAITCLSNPIIYCSRCERGAHRICLRLPSVPSEDFFCVSCCEELKKKTRKKEKETVLPTKPEPEMTNWIHESKALPLRCRFGEREKTEELLVDRSVLLMKNRNFASRTEDINRVLSSKLNIKFEGRLYRLSENWVHLEVPLRVLMAMVYALIKSNFHVKGERQNGMILDLRMNKLFMTSCKQDSANRVFLSPDKNYNLEDWVYSSQFCVRKAETTPKDEKQSAGKRPSQENWEEILDYFPKSILKEQSNLEREMEREKQANIKKVLEKGSSNVIKAKSTKNCFEVFRCENMMVLKKFLENDQNLKMCILEDATWMQKMKKEISYEIRRVVQMFRDCQAQIFPFSFVSNSNQEKSVSKILSNKFESPKKKNSFSNSFTNPNMISKNESNLSLSFENPIFERPKALKSGKALHDLEKLNKTNSKEFVIQDIKMSKIVSFKGHILDDIRCHEGLILFNHQRHQFSTVKLFRHFKNEICLFVHKQQKNEKAHSKKDSGSTDMFEIQEESLECSLLAKGKFKDKPLDSDPCLKSKNSGVVKFQSRDNCLYCNKSDLMLIDFENKKVHLFCLIISGNLLNFFERPQCKLSTFVIFIKLIKYNLLNFLLEKNWIEKIYKIKNEFKEEFVKKTKISFEISLSSKLFGSENEPEIILGTPWKHFRLSPAITHRSPESNRTASGISSLVLPPIRKMQLNPIE